jgi:hypothetical protein
MKRTLITATVFAASAALGAAAYAQDAHNHGTPKSGPLAAQGHDAHCCKPDPSDMKGMQGMAGHDHTQASKKPMKKAAEKDAKEKSPEAK